MSTTAAPVGPTDSTTKATPTARTDAPASLEDLRARFTPVLAEIAEGAVEREHERRLPFAEVRALADAGFTAITVPREQGGSGADVEALFGLLIDLGEADSNLPQLLRAHFAFANGLLLGDEEEDPSTWQRLLAGGAVFGNASHERSTARVGDLATTVVPDGEDFLISGEKAYSTGSIFADWINVTAQTPGGRRARVTVRRDDAGVEVRDDWDGFGQQLTGSGTTVLRDVRVPASRVRIRGGSADGLPTPQTAFLQLVLLSSLVGVGRAALRDGVEFVRSRTRVYSQGSGATAAEDPLVQAVVGRLSAKLAAAKDSVLAAARVLGRAQDSVIRDHRDGVAGSERSLALIDAAELRTVQAQLTAVDNVLAVTTQLFEVGGASATSRGRALDRHWRNARTLSSHNPAIYQERAIGDRLLNDSELLYFWSTGEKKKS
ncbi:acyl-CoA dehydrogenase family protein [Brachybacterium kimchii]|uniref:Dibenzothiophene monooxygenase n=1 Tax=Brachybacterium kimchii TaxID=2942909 RepID=A0ABY4N456_9MICO|nr:acyl-CoA dehydrogenase family protein [Brachybacterium kimchii]UQN28631.1 acyl-CoA dehydrogenase family protein [Brachybacterium kimchii]